MTKLRKQKRKKRFRYSVNRKRLRNKITSIGKISCKEIENEWEKDKSMYKNISDMGLSYDPNETIKISNIIKKESKPPVHNKFENEWIEEPQEIVNENDEIPESKKSVALKLLEDAKAPRRKLLRLPGSEVEWITYLMDKYGKAYRSMARDKKNIHQQSWKQIRQKIKLFKSIPEQYSEYLRHKGIEHTSDVEMSETSDGEL